MIKKRATVEGRELGLAEGRELGLEAGIERTKQEVIMSMHEEGYDIATISKIVKVPISKVEQIIRDSNNKTKRK